MKVILRNLWVMVIVCCFTNVAAAQTPDIKPQGLMSKKLVKQISSRALGMNIRISRQNRKYLIALSRMEKTLTDKLAKNDSTRARRLAEDGLQQYQKLLENPRNVVSTIGNMQGGYISHIDSLAVAFKMFESTRGLQGAGKTLDNTIEQLDVLQDNFQQAAIISRYINERSRFLQKEFGNAGLPKELGKYARKVYYYQAQMNEYKQLVNNPAGIERKALQLLRQTTAFQNFFKSHSQLSGMFSIPGKDLPNSDKVIEGLQTRAAVQQAVSDRFGKGVSIQQTMHGQVINAQQELDKLKDKITRAAGRNSIQEMPGFRPNNQKTKSLKNRLELGTNLQSVRSNRFFPTTTDIGLSLGYKLNDKSIVGIGGSYKLGWGKDLKHVSISHQGMAIRSFLDWKIKGSFWISGGGEMNYRSELTSFDILRDFSSWQKSALVGISKKYHVSKKVKGNAQLFYDILWKEQVPRTQPLVFRIGYISNNNYFFKTGAHL